MLYLHQQWLQNYGKLKTEMVVQNNIQSVPKPPFQVELLGYDLIIFKEIDNKEIELHISFMPALSTFKVCAIYLDKQTGKLEEKAQRFDTQANAINYSNKDNNRIVKKYHPLVKQGIEYYKLIFTF